MSTQLYPLVSSGKTPICAELRDAVAQYTGCDPYAHCNLVCYALCPKSDCATTCRRLIEGKPVELPSVPTPTPPPTTPETPETKKQTTNLWNIVIFVVLVLFVIFFIKK